MFYSEIVLPLCRCIKPTTFKKMKNLFIYLTLIVTTIFFVYCSLVMDIPTDNQIGMFFFGVMSFSLFVIVFIYDVRNSHKERKQKPQTF